MRGNSQAGAEGGAVDRDSYGFRRRELGGLLTRSAFLKLGGTGIAGAALLGVAGCGGERGGRSRAVARAGTGGPAQEGGTLVFGVDAIQGNADPAIFATFGDWMVIDCVARGLTHIDYVTTEVKPALATSWEVSGRRDRLHVQAARRRQVPRRNPPDGDRLRAVVHAAHGPRRPEPARGAYAIAEIGGENVKKCGPWTTRPSRSRSACPTWPF
jgi:hypothetical protein